MTRMAGLAALQLPRLPRRRTPAMEESPGSRWVACHGRAPRCRKPPPLQRQSDRRSQARTRWQMPGCPQHQKLQQGILIQNPLLVLPVLMPTWAGQGRTAREGTAFPALYDSMSGQLAARCCSKMSHRWQRGRKD